MSSSAAKRFERIMITERTVHEAGRLAHYMIRHQVYGKTEVNTDARTLQQTLNVALVVTYARPFTRNFGAAKLKEFFDVEALYTDEERELHEALYDLRSRLSAHSDASEYKFHFHGDRYLPAMTYPMPSLSLEQLEMLRLMLTKMDDALRQSRAQLSNQ